MLLMPRYLSRGELSFPKKATAYFRTGAPSSLLSMLRLSHNWSLKLGDFIGLLVPIEFTKFETKSETSAICSPWSPLTSRWTSSTADCRLIVSRISSHIRSPVREKIVGSSINYYQHIFGYSVAALSVCRTSINCCTSATSHLIQCD